MTWDPIWEEVFSRQSWGSYPAEHLVRFVARNFYKFEDRAAIKVLEVGCGPGSNIWCLAREGFSFAGIDGSPTAIKLASERLDADCADWRVRGDLRVGDIARLPFVDNQFDGVIDVEALCCNSWESSRAIYREMARVTKPGGLLYSQTFSTSSWGCGSGDAVGRNAWRSSEGPFADKGVTRFTDFDEIEDLVDGFDVTAVEISKCSVGGRKNEIHEWIITAQAR